MTRLIGGLLVVSLLYGPAIFSVKYLALSATKDSGNIILPSMKNEVISNNLHSGDMDYAFDELDATEQRLTALIREKNILFSKIESELDLRSHLKISLNEKQINGFTGFMECYNSESASIQNNLDKINRKSALGRTLADFLHNSEYIDIALSELNTISKYQNNAINSILRIIDSGNKLLKLL